MPVVDYFICVTYNTTITLYLKKIPQENVFQIPTFLVHYKIICITLKNIFMTNCPLNYETFQIFEQRNFMNVST